MGLRKTKKERTREQILACAKELFATQSYENTTTDEIAACADIGSGTIYNYYSSKAEILLAVLQDDFDLMPQALHLKEEDMEKEITFLITSYVKNYMSRFNFLNKKFLLDIVTALLTLTKKNKKLMTKIIELDFKFIDHLELYLGELKDNRLLGQETDIRQLAELIYAALMYEVMMVLLADDLPLERAIENTEKKIHYLLRK